MNDPEVRTVPDPSTLTTEQLERGLSNLQDLLEAQVKGYELECGEKFRSVEQRFALVERQRVEQKTDTKDAVDAAFSAAKEAVREQTTASDRAIQKSETSMLEQLKQLGSTFTTAIDGLRRDIDDLKERVGGAEQLKQGGAEVTAKQGDSTARLIAGVSALVAFFAVIAAIVIAAVPG